MPVSVEEVPVAEPAAVAESLDPADTGMQGDWRHAVADPPSSEQLAAAYAAFYLRELKAVSRTVFLIVHDREAAEDITQDAFVQLFVHWRKVCDYDRPGAWVRRVAIRLATRVVRRDRVREMLSSREASMPPQAMAVDVDLLQALRRLPARQRAAVVMHYYEDRPVAEIAEVLDWSPGAVKVALHRARKTLAALLDVEGASDVQ
jgi:RNA polymerase sigma-70 factor (sigma-E family)